MVTQDRIDLVFKALADPTRRAILASLQRRAQAVLAVSKSFPEMSRPAISKHLRILREAGLVEEEQQGRQRFYRLVEGSLAAVTGWVESLQPTRRTEPVARKRPRPSAGSQDWRVW